LGILAWCTSLPRHRHGRHTLRRVLVLVCMCLTTIGLIDSRSLPGRLLLLHLVAKIALVLAVELGVLLRVTIGILVRLLLVHGLPVRLRLLRLVGVVAKGSLVLRTGVGEGLGTRFVRIWLHLSENCSFASLST